MHDDGSKSRQEDGSKGRLGRHKSAPEQRRDFGPEEERRSSDWEKRRPKQAEIVRSTRPERSEITRSTRAHGPENRHNSSSSNHRAERQRSTSGDRQRTSSGDRQRSSSGNSSRVSPAGDYQRAFSMPAGEYNRALSPPFPDQPRRTPSPMDTQRCERNISPRAGTPDQQKASPHRKPSPKSFLEFDPVSAMDFPRPSDKSGISRVRTRSAVGKTSLSPERFSSLRRSSSEAAETSGRMFQALQESCNENKYSLDMIVDNGPGSFTTARLDNKRNSANVDNAPTIQGAIQGSGNCTDNNEIITRPSTVNDTYQMDSLHRQAVGPTSVSLEQSEMFSNTITMPGSRECLQSRPVSTVALRLANDSSSKEDISCIDFHFKRLSMSAQTVV